jgi:hypothetical protein
MTPRAQRRPSHALARRQRGVATLIIVAVLFFIVSLVAAYTNRNLIFEQRTSANQYRSTLALEAAEAGLEWSLSMLNGGRIDANCAASTTVTDTSFRQRYLAIDDDTGLVEPAGTLVVTPTGASAGTVWPSCVFGTGTWACSCPDPGGAPALTEPAADGLPHPAFRVRFVRLSGTRPPGAVRVEVNGCTRLDDACLNFPATGVGGEGRASLSVVIALRGGLAAPPAAALTVREDLNVGGALAAYNGDATTGGLAVMTGGAINAPLLTTSSAPGAPPNSGRLPGDQGLIDLGTGARLFATTFASWAPGGSAQQQPAWRDQPALQRLDCTVALCDGDDLRDAVALNPGHVVWVDGDIALDGAGDIGSATEPLVVVVDGQVTDIAAGTTFHGLLHVRAADWAAAGDGLVRGAVIAENEMSGNASFDVVRDADVLRRARWQTGSFVRVPGGWRDF